MTSMEKKKRRSLIAAKTIRSTVISCLLFGAIVLVVGLGFYAYTVSNQYIKHAFETAEHASISVSMEDFYAMAGEADFLIWYANIPGSVSTVAELTAVSDLLADFKAVREGNVWCAGKDLYQATDHVGAFITDVHRMLTGEEGEMAFLSPVK